MSKFRIFFVSITIIGLFAAVVPSPVDAATEPGVLIVKVKSPADGLVLAPFGEVQHLFGNMFRLVTEDKDHARYQLDNNPQVVFVSEDQVVETEKVALDPLFALDTKAQKLQWYMPKIEVHQAWEQTIGSPVIVAIVDTGIFAAHEDLNDGRVVGGYASYCQSIGQAKGECLLRVTGDLPANSNSDDNGHGTVVAGLIGAIPNNGRGMAGINWSARLMPIKALNGSGVGFASDVAVGIKWAADHGAQILNLSLGGPGIEGLEVLQETISYAYNRGVLIVAAAGNDAAINGGNLNATPSLPVCADGGQNMVIGVAALDINDVKTKFSNYGSNCIDISAPGAAFFIDQTSAGRLGIVSTVWDPRNPQETDRYAFGLGTSIAAPIVTGVASLVMAAYPDLDIRAVRNRIINNVDSIDELNATACADTSCAGHLGKGRVNAYKAVSNSSGINSGNLIKSAGGLVFLVERGLRRPISEFVFRQRFNGLPVTTVDAAQLEALPQGTQVPPADGTLILGQGDGTVFLVEGGERRGLSYLAFISRGFRFEDVAVLSLTETLEYPRGSDAPVLDGALMKEAGSPAVYITSGGFRRLLSFFVFKQREFDKRPIAIVTREELERFPLPAPFYFYPSAEGTLLKGDASPVVYLVQDGKRRGLNLNAFQNRGFKFADVKTIPQGDLQYYEAGEDIIE